MRPQRLGPGRALPAARSARPWRAAPSGAPHRLGVGVRDTTFKGDSECLGLSGWKVTTH